MPVTYVDRTIGGKVKKAIVVTGTGATEEILLKERLFDVDVAAMERVDAETGADFKAKLEAHTLRNGKNAWDHYGSLVALTDTLTANAAKYARLNDPAGAIEDLEARVTVLEP